MATDYAIPAQSIRGGHARERTRFHILAASPDARALTVWFSSRLFVLCLSWAAVDITHSAWLNVWPSWDAGIFVRIAQYGYFSPDSVAHSVAFFPGLPILLAVMHALIPQWAVDGLLISLVSGAFACLALRRIADYWSPGTGSKAVLFLVASPAAFFLAAGYTESLFLAFALWCWVLLLDGRRYAAIFCAAGACAVRVDGLFLCAAVALFLITRSAWRYLPALSVSVLPAACYELYLWAKTGDWMAWDHAEAIGWDRHFTNPVSSFVVTLHAAESYPMPYTFTFSLEIAAVLIGAVTVAWLSYARRWPELLFASLAVGTLATSTWYESVPRSLLLLWPLWCGLARLSQRYPWAGRVYLTASLPVCAAVGLLFLTGHWAG